MTLLNHAKTNGEVMTMGDYALAMQFDNAPTVANPDQVDADHDGIGDAIDGAVLTAAELQIESPASDSEVTLMATLLNGSMAGIPGQTVMFFIDTDNDGSEEEHAATTGEDGRASVVVTVSGGLGTVFDYRASWDGGLVTTEDGNIVRVGDPVALKIAGVEYTPGADLELTVEGLNPLSTYRLVRSTGLPGFPDTPVSGFVPEASTDTMIDPDPPAGGAFYRVEEE